MRPSLHATPFLVRQWDGTPDFVTLNELVTPIVLAGSDLCSVGGVFDCNRIRIALNRIQSDKSDFSFYDIASVSAAIHFGDLIAIHPEALRIDLLELSIGLFDEIVNNSREKFARKLERFFWAYEADFVNIFGTSKYAYQSFEYLFAVMHMEVISVQQRHSLMFEFMGFMDEASKLVRSKAAIIGGEFGRVSLLISLRQSKLDPIVKGMTDILLDRITKA